MDKLSEIKKRLDQKPNKNGFNRLMRDLIAMKEFTQFSAAFDLVAARIDEGTDADRTLVLSSWDEIDLYKTVLIFARRIELQ